MRGSPRSLVLSWANSVTGWWTSMAVSAVQRQQRAVVDATLRAMKPKPARKLRKKRKVG
jgi:hypothetical protein